MRRIENIRASWYDAENIFHVVADIQVSTAEELPTLGGYVGVNAIEAGTIAQVIQDANFLTLDENGTWYPEQSSTSTLSAPLSTPLTLGKTVKPAVIEPESFEPDELEQEQTEAEPQEVTEDAELL